MCTVLEIRDQKNRYSSSRRQEAVCVEKGKERNWSRNGTEEGPEIDSESCRGL